MAQAARKSPPRWLEVVRTEPLGRNLQRITFRGPELGDIPRDRAGAHIKLFFPRAHQREPTLPTVSDHGIAWPPEAERPIVRTYSLRASQPEVRHVTVEFVRHVHGGPAAKWAMHARPGDRIGMAGPGGPIVPPRAPFIGFCIDLSALPAVSAILAALPADARGHVLCEVPDRGDVRPLEHPPGVELAWRVRPDGEASGLFEASRHLPWHTPGAYAFLAGENAFVVEIRDWLRRSFGYDRHSMYAVPYWKHDHDEEAYHRERHRIMDELEEAAR